MKRILIFTAFIVSLVFLFASAGWCKEPSAKEIFDHLYKPSGQEPIADIVINFDIKCEVRETEKSSKEDIVVSQDKVFFKFPDKIRAESVITHKYAPSMILGQTTIVIRDGKRWFLFTGLSNWPRKVGADDHSFIDRLPFKLQSYPADEGKIKYFRLGNEIKDGKNIVVIGILNADLDTATKADTRTQLKKLWIDTEKWVPTELEYYTIRKEKKDDKGKEEKKDDKGKEEEKVVRHKLVYGEPQQLPDGRWIPFVIKSYEKVESDDEVLVETIVYRKLAVNVGLDDGLFEVLSKYLPKE